LKTNLRILALLCGLLFVATAAASTPDLASALVRNTSEKMLEALEARRSELENQPSLVFDLVENIVVPNFDFERITRFAMGRYWRSADKTQQDALIEEFKQMLVRTYAKALLNYSGQQIEYLPLRPGNREGQVTVRTAVSEAGGPTIPIDYQLYLKDGAWKVYDVAIDGVSLVANYRSSFAAEIRRKGVDGLIATLRERNQGGKSS